jgi:hypothetical protein
MLSTGNNQGFVMRRDRAVSSRIVTSGGHFSDENVLAWVAEICGSGDTADF